MDGKQLRDFVVAPALKAIGLWSEAAERLVMGTAAHESEGFKWIDQTTAGPGPALGLWQIEPATYDDLVKNTLPGLRDPLRSALRPILDPPPPAQRLWSDLRLGAVVCRLLYYRAPAALPSDPGDIGALAAYWKRYYNTMLGAGVPAVWIANFRRYCSWYV